MIPELCKYCDVKDECISPCKEVKLKVDRDGYYKKGVYENKGIGAAWSWLSGRTTYGDYNG